MTLTVLARLCARCGNPIERTATGWGTRVHMRRGRYHRPLRAPSMGSPAAGVAPVRGRSGVEPIEGVPSGASGQSGG